MYVIMGLYGLGKLFPMASADTQARLNPNTRPWLPQPLYPNQTPPAAFTTPYYQYTFIPTFNFRYFMHPPELLSPPAKAALQQRRFMRRGGRRPNMVGRRWVVSGGKSGKGGRCGTRGQGVGETVMLRNIPNQFSRQMMLEFLDKLCYNHNAHIAAAQWINKEMLDEYKWGVVNNNHGFCFDSKKICQVTRARIQGKHNLIKHFHFMLFGCSTADYLPVILWPPRDGVTSFSLPATIGRHLGSY